MKFLLVFISLFISSTVKAFDIYKCSSDTMITIGGCGYGLKCLSPDDKVITNSWFHSEPHYLKFTVLRTNEQVSLKVKSKVWKNFKRENVPDFIEQMKNFGKKQYIFANMFESRPDFIHVYNQDLTSFRYKYGKFHLITEIYNSHLSLP